MSYFVTEPKNRKSWLTSIEKKIKKAAILDRSCAIHNVYIIHTLCIQRVYIVWAPP